MHGDILENSVKNVFNDKVITISKEEISNLIIEIEKSDMENKESVIEKIKNNSEDSLKIKDYLGYLSNITTIPANIVSIIDSILKN